MIVKQHKNGQTAYHQENKHTSNASKSLKSYTKVLWCINYVDLTLGQISSNDDFVPSEDTQYS